VEARISAQIQSGPGVHPASSKIGTGSFAEMKRPERGVDHPFTYSTKVKEGVVLYKSTPHSVPPCPDSNNNNNNSNNVLRDVI